MLAFGQTERNIFDGEEASETTSKFSGPKIEDRAETKWEKDTNPQGKPGNPGSPPNEGVPIDGALPLLLIAGSVIIFYYVKRQKSINI